MSPRAFRLALLGLVALYLAQGLYYARTVVPVSDGIQYLMIGARAVRGELGVFDDRLPGNRLPLPFYVLGLTQAGGPNLVLPRLLNVAFATATLLIVVWLARRLGGDRAGLLAGLFLATQGVVIAYYSYESYPAFAALCLTAAVAVSVTAPAPGRRRLGAALTALLFFVRSNLWPAIPFLLGHALWRARGAGERVALAAVVVLPPLAFLAWDPTHLKILAYVPLVRRLVAPLGYDASAVLDVQQKLPFAAQLWALVILGRRYEFWVFATAALALLAALRWRRRGWLLADVPGAAVLVVFLTYMLAANFAMFWWNWKWVGLYFVSFAPVLPVVLGLGYDRLLAATAPGSRGRRALAALLLLLLLPPMYWARNPLLPIGEVKARDPFAAVHEVAARLRAAVPADARVFSYGPTTAYYLAGLPQTYLQQLYNPDAVARADADETVLRRFGFVSARQLRGWLAREADVAVIDRQFFQARIADPELAGGERLIQDLLARHFQLVERVDYPPFFAYEIYRRRAEAGRRAGS